MRGHAEKQCRATLPQVLETDRWQTRFLQNRFVMMSK